jgi:DNA replication protein DnaC
MQKQSSPTKQTTGIDKKILEGAGIMERFQSIKFENVVPTEDIKENANMVLNYANNIEQHIANGEGLILSGSYGTMKTTLAICVLRKYLEQGGRGLFVPMCSMMDSLYSMKIRNTEEWMNYETRLRTTSLLIVDDLGSEDVSAPWVLSKVNSIITERYNRKKSIIVTTNLTKEELAKTYAGRIIDRLRSTNYYISFTGKTKRVGLKTSDLRGDKHE